MSTLLNIALFCIAMAVLSFIIFVITVRFIPQMPPNITLSDDLKKEMEDDLKQNHKCLVLAVTLSMFAMITFAIVTVFVLVIMIIAAIF